MQPTVISETPITMSELREGVARIRKRDPEPSFRVTRTEEYISSFEVLAPKQAAELADKLAKLNVPRLKDIHISKIIDILPADANDLKLLLQGYTITVSNDNVKKIVDVVREVTGK